MSRLVWALPFENDNNRKEDACCCHKAAKNFLKIEESK